MNRISIVIAFLLLQLVTSPAQAVADGPVHSIFLPFLNNLALDPIEVCSFTSLPVGAIPGQPLPVFCTIANQGPDTSVSGSNTWSDTFNHNLSTATFSSTGYTVFENVGFVRKTLHWRHANHWMVDVATNQDQGVRGGAVLRPNQSFRFIDNTFTVEAETAAGIEAYANEAWPEILISTSPIPTDTGGLYGYDLFPEGYSIGCRLQPSRVPVCSLKANDGSIADKITSTRIWEMSFHQVVGTTNYGGFPLGGGENYWRSCDQTDPDMTCRDRFRIVLKPTSLTLYVNGYKYFEQTGIPALPDEFVNGDLYVYFASMVVNHDADVIRFHWDQLSVNPEKPGALENEALLFQTRRNWR